MADAASFAQQARDLITSDDESVWLDLPQIINVVRPALSLFFEDVLKDENSRGMFPTEKLTGTIEAGRLDIGNFPPYLNPIIDQVEVFVEDNLARTVSDVVTDSSDAITSATANFGVSDVGKAVHLEHGMSTFDSTIIDALDETTVLLAEPVTFTATGVTGTFTTPHTVWPWPVKVSKTKERLGLGSVTDALYLHAYVEGDDLVFDQDKTGSLTLAEPPVLDGNVVYVNSPVVSLDVTSLPELLEGRFVVFLSNYVKDQLLKRP